MESNISSLILVAMVILLILSALMAALEMALASVNRIHVKNKVTENKQARKVLKMIEQYDQYITTIVILNDIFQILLSTLSSIFFLNLFGGNELIAVIFSTGVMTIFLIIFGEIFPKIYAKENPEKVLYSLADLLLLLRKIIYVLVLLFSQINQLFINRIRKSKTNSDNETSEVENEILTIIEESTEEGKFPAKESELLRNAIEFNDIRVAEILRPKSEFIMAELHQSIEDLNYCLKNEKYARIPIYEEREENIIGMISERDFFINYQENKEFPLSDILQPIQFIPDTLKISKLMVKMQKEHLQMVIVVDERGTIQGLITFEDILEELVGEIWDEHEEADLEYTQINNHEFICVGQIPINTFNGLFKSKDISSQTEESTLAGYLLELFETIPAQNDQISDENFNYQIIEVSGKKIEKIRVKELEKESEENEKSL